MKWLVLILMVTTLHAEDTVLLSISGVETPFTYSQAALLISKLPQKDFPSVLGTLPTTQAARLQVEVRKALVVQLDEYLAGAVQRVRNEISWLTPEELQAFIVRLRPIYVDSMAAIETHKAERKAADAAAAKAAEDAKAAELEAARKAAEAESDPLTDTH